ncbi:MAG: DMT family transporter, partial [Hyphomicrobiales bacterium]
ILLPFVLRARGLRIRHRVWVHVARGVLLAVATLMFFTSLAVLPLADAIAIFFVEPLILTVLSAVFLGEPVGWRRLLAVAVGFIGALIIIRPSFAIFGPTALLPLGTALAFAIYLVLTRLLVVAESTVTLQFYAGVFGSLAMTVALWLGVVGDISVLTPAMPSARQWLLLALMGLIATVGHQFVVLAIRRVGAGMVAPFQYMEIISATLLGMVLFDEFPDTATWAGVGIIVGAGLYVYIRERRRVASDDKAGEPPPV